MVKQKRVLGRLAAAGQGADTRARTQRACPQPPLGSGVLNCPRAHGSDVTRGEKKTVLGWLCSQRDVQACGGARKIMQDCWE